MSDRLEQWEIEREAAIEGVIVERDALRAECERLILENVRLREKNDRQMRTVSDAVYVAEEVVRVRKEAAGLRALISWVDGMLVDESAPMVIREGIYKALEAL